jgi:hypothetical protein
LAAANTLASQVSKKVGFPVISAPLSQFVLSGISNQWLEQRETDAANPSVDEEDVPLPHEHDVERVTALYMRADDLLNNVNSSAELVKVCRLVLLVRMLIVSFELQFLYVIPALASMVVVSFPTRVLARKCLPRRVLSCSTCQENPPMTSFSIKSHCLIHC